MADDFPSPDQIAQIKAIQATRPQLPQPTPNMISSALYGLVSNPALDRLISGESFTSPPITPETKPGYLGPSAEPWKDAYVGGLLGGAGLVGGPEMLIAKGLSLGAKALGGLGTKAAVAFAPKVGERLGAQEMLKAIESKLTPTGVSFVASPEAVKAGIASQEKGGGPWYTGLSNEDIAHTLHGVMHTPGHDKTYIQAFEKLPQDTKSEVAGHINSLLQQSADDALKKLQGAMKAPAMKPSVAPAPGGGSWLTPQEHADNLMSYMNKGDDKGYGKYWDSLSPEVQKEVKPVFDKVAPAAAAPADVPSNPYTTTVHLLSMLEQGDHKGYGTLVSQLPPDHLNSVIDIMKKEGWHNLHEGAIEKADAQDPLLFAHVPGGVEELTHGVTKDMGWAGWNTPKEAAADLAAMWHNGDYDAWEHAISQMPHDFWSKVNAEMPAAFAEHTGDPYAQVPYHEGPAQKYNPSLPSLVNPADVSADAISKALEKDPGASIFDVAKVKMQDWQEKVTSIMRKSDRAQAQEELKQKTLGRLDNPAYQIPFLGSPEQQNIYKGLGFQTPFFHATQRGMVGGVPFEAFKNPTGELGIHGGTEEAAHTFIGEGSAWEGAAKGYGQPASPGARVYPLVARANRPLYLPDLGSWGTEKMAEGLTRFSTIPKADIQAASRGGIEDIRDLLTKKGYDIIPYVNKAEDPGSVSWLTWQPERLRSPFAKFKDLQLNHLLAGITGIGVAAPVVGQALEGQNAGASQ